MLLSDFSFTPAEQIFESLRKAGPMVGMAPPAAKPAAMTGMTMPAAAPKPPANAMAAMGGGTAAPPDLNDVKYDGLELSEVIRNLAEETKKRDPDRVGINFLILPDTGGGAPPAGAIDPATGLPVAALPVEAVDVGTVRIKINPPLVNLRLADVLDAIIRTAVIGIAEACVADPDARLRILLADCIADTAATAAVPGTAINRTSSEYAAAL